MSSLSMDLEVMLRSQKGHWFILCIIDEVTNYLITTPFTKPNQKKSEKLKLKMLLPSSVLQNT